MDDKDLMRHQLMWHVSQVEGCARLIDESTAGAAYLAAKATCHAQAAVAISAALQAQNPSEAR